MCVTDQLFSLGNQRRVLDQREGYEESLEWIDFMLGIPDDWVHTLERPRKLRQMRPVLDE